MSALASTLSWSQYVQQQEVARRRCLSDPDKNVANRWRQKIALKQWVVRKLERRNLIFLQVGAPVGLSGSLSVRVARASNCSG
jgi:hypothetical protein